MINKDYKFIFIHINKTGGTSIEKVFDNQADERDVTYKHITAQTYQNRHPIIFKEYFKFAFVRNPWDWLVSRYFWSTGRQTLIDCSFDDFILGIKNKSLDIPNWLHKALCPQHSFITINDIIAVDFMGRFENLQSDFDIICNIINYPQTQLPTVFKTKHRHYSTYYTDNTKNIVAELYRRDIQLFDYTFETEA